MKIFGTSGILITLVFLLSSPISAATIHVPADQPTIQAGVDTAQEGDIVLVALGTYNETIDFGGKNIILQSVSGADVTIIDGNENGSVMSFTSGERKDAVLDGFTITNGSGTDVGDYSYGGGIYCVGASPTIRNCTFFENKCSLGGGIYALAESEPTVSNCIFRKNVALDGGGIHFRDSPGTVENCWFRGNTATTGNGIRCWDSDAVITNCSISNGIGDAISCQGCSPTISNCTIQNNLCGLRGAICCDYAGPVLTNCLITGNVGNNMGGGISCFGSAPLIINCTISGNSADYGGGIWCRDFSSPTIVNSILWGNTALEGPEIWVGDSIWPVNFPSSLTVRFSDVQGGETAVHIEDYCELHWLEGNIDADPLFAGAGDFRIIPGSPCVDAGDPDPIHEDGCFPPSIGAARNDMGVYGGPGACGFCGDLDGDGYDEAVCGGNDCDNLDPDAHPGAPEVIDGRDNDCDGQVDELCFIHVLI